MAETPASSATKKIPRFYFELMENYALESRIEDPSQHTYRGNFILKLPRASLSPVDSDMVLGDI